MSSTRHFADELLKIAFKLSAPPILSSALGKTTKGVIAKPQTTLKLPTVKTPAVKAPKSVPAASGRVRGIKLDPARANPSPPSAFSGGTNVR